ncbi:RING-H2 finger protein ATL11 [Cucumis sativus]|uniref:RING-type E3 ubiquitin transferase n=1 Tax=Cucumis sativus TaxID=3659 RepID=A0A0A0LE06_CUCSA|nr:RING-H2 finger protein ATL11 [Cucumis sativus]KGN60240.1 hypothetical protein Csa_001910 [Cucumis sativus]
MITIMVIGKKNHVLTCQFLLLMLLLLLLPPPPAAAQEAGTGTIPVSSEPEVSKTMAIAFVALISGFFVLGIVSIYTRRCRERRMGGVGIGIGGGGGGGGVPWRPSRGLDPAFIATFPTFVYSKVKGLKIGKSSLECAVCLNEFENSDMLRLIPKCSHVFHSGCVDAWLISHSTCPVCRANLCPKPGEVTLSIFNFDPSTGSERIGLEQSPTPSPSPPPNHVTIPVVEDRRAATETTNVTNPSPVANWSTPTRSRSLGWRLSEIFQRSNSTGHERFTLRLPEAVRSQLLNSTLNRTRSLAELPRVQSSRRGYRGGTGESGGWRKFLQRNFSLPAPLVGRTADNGRYPVDEDLGERSFARLTSRGNGPSTAAE